MSDIPRIISGLDEIAANYDALICDVWGVLHNGRHAFQDAVDALKRFRGEFGPVVLLSNAPRPVPVLEEQFERFGVALDCYDAIVTSGVATRDALAARAKSGRLAMLHIGPERDRGVFEGLPIDCVEAGEASVALCTGLFDDDHETPDDYVDMLADLQRRGLTMLCANPDIVVQRGGQLVYCAGAITRLYEEMGGKAVYYGKPYKPIYDATMRTLREAAARDVKRPLAIGDGIETDIRGANGAMIDALFIADGIHGEDVGEFSAPALSNLFAKSGVSARAAMRALVW